ncbi:MAG: NUDIX hydrolase [archaeon]|jgi:8-oxo-dGTP diphosphatase
MIYLQEPLNFNPKFEIVSCFVEFNGGFVLLHRQDNKSQGNTWGMPAGKVKLGEKILDAIVRELLEETGLAISSDKLVYFNKIFVRSDEYDFIYHIFVAKFNEKPLIIISPKEHKAFKWVTPKEALHMPLIHELGNCIKLYYKV